MSLIEQLRGWCGRRSGRLTVIVTVFCLVIPLGVTVQGQPQPGAPGDQSSGAARSRNNNANRGGGRPGFGGGRWWQTRERLDQNEVSRMAEVLELDEGQIAIISAMFSSFDEAYQNEVDQSRKEFEDTMRGIRESGDWTNMMPKMMSLGRESEGKAADLEASFLNDIQESILTKEQQARWPSYEQARRRRATLVAGARIPGEGVDLIALVDEQELTEEERARIEPTLESYATELDHALTDRDRYVNEVMNRLDTIMKGEDQRNVDDVMRVGNEKRETIRTINTNYAELIASQLDSPAGSEILDTFHKKAYPRIYQDTAVNGYAEKLFALDSLSEDQRRQISAVYDDYESRIRDLNRQLAVLDTKQQEERQARMYQGFQLMYTEGPGAARDQMRQMWQSFRAEQQQDQSTDPMYILREEKVDLETTTLDGLVQVLTPEQVGEAPRPQPEADRVKRQEEREKRIEQWRERRQQRSTQRDGARG